MYRYCWNYFLDNLKSVNCDYWASLYEKLFESGFELDIEVLERRLNVPDEIKAKGAAAVGKYLGNPKNSDEKRDDKVNNVIEAAIKYKVSPEDEQREQEKILTELKHHYLREKLVLILGAGVSIDAKLPLWDDLVKNLSVRMINYVNEKDGSHIDPSEVKKIAKFALENKDHSPLIQMSNIRNAYKDDIGSYNKSIHAALYENEPDFNSELLTVLASLCTHTRHHIGVKHVITYNFDDLLEKALHNQHVKYNCICKDYDMPHLEHLNLYHVHGFLPEDLKNPNDIKLVFSEEDYHRINSDVYCWPNIVQVNSFREDTCLFIGCSFNDPNMRRLLSVTAKTVTEPRHFAIMQRNSAMLVRPKDDVSKSDLKAFEEYIRIDHSIRERQFRSLGIKTIWFNDFIEIPEILSSLGR